LSNFFLSWTITFILWGFIFLSILTISKFYQLIFKIRNDKIKNFLESVLILLICLIPFIIYFGPKGSLLVLFIILYLSLWVNLTLFIIKILNYFNDNYFFIKKLSLIKSNIFGKFVLSIIFIFWVLLIIDTAGNLGRFLGNNYYFIKYIK